MTPAHVFGILLVAAVIAIVAVALRRREDPEFDSRVSRWLESDAADAAEAPAQAGPTAASVARPTRWAVLVDTAWDARSTDADLVYLQAVLLDEGIAAEFAPWRPGENFGLFGAQLPVKLMVDAGRVGEARQVMADVLPLDPSLNHQARLPDPNLSIPGTREGILMYAGMRRLAETHGGWYALAWRIVLFLLAMQFLTYAGGSLLSR